MTGKLTEQLRREALRVEEDCEHSLKGHYNASDEQVRLYNWLGIPAAICAAISTGSAFGSYSVFAGISAGIATLLTAALMFLKPLEKAETHKTAAGQYHALRNKVRRFREIELLENSDVNAMKQRLLDMGERQDELNQSSPTIPRTAYEKAKEDIDANMTQYRVDSNDSSNG
jgi:hypothetical protein